MPTYAYKGRNRLNEMVTGERFELHGGRVDVQAGERGGFEVRAFLPLPAPA